MRSEDSSETFEHSFADHFLVAMPSLTQANFSQSVVYLFEHNEHGALGMVVNKPLQISLGNVLDHLGIAAPPQDIAKLPVMAGGPVGQEHGFIIYTDDLDVTLPEVHVSASKDMLIDISKNQGPEHFVVTLGYSGWSGGQLESEIKRNDWLLVPAEPRLVFEIPLSQQWEKAAALIGVDINKLSDQVGHA